MTIDPVFEEEISIANVIQLLRKNLIWIFLATFGFGIAVYFVSINLPPRYASASRVVVAQTVFTQGLVGLSQSSVSLDGRAYTEAAKSKTIQTNALAKVFGEEALKQEERLEELFARFRTRVKLIEGRSSAVLTLEVATRDRGLAQTMTQAWSEALIAWDRDRVRRSVTQYRASLEAQVSALRTALRSGSLDNEVRRSLEAQLGAILRDLYMARSLEATTTGQLALLESATLPKQVFPRPWLYALLGGLVGGIAVFLLVLLRDSLDTRVRSSEEVHRLTGLPVLSEFPDLPPGSPAETSDMFKEAASYLRTSLRPFLMNEEPKILTITSPSPSEGKTSIALGLAQTYARGGQKTLLVDLDLRHPRLTKRVAELYGVSPKQGLEAFFKLPISLSFPEPVQLADDLYLCPTLEAQQNSPELLGQEIRTLIRLLSESYDFQVIILDNPPIVFSDVLVVAPHTSGVLLVVAEQQSDRKAVHGAIEIIKQIGVRVLGIAMNRVSKTRLSRALQYGAYGYRGQKLNGKDIKHPNRSLPS